MSRKWKVYTHVYMNVYSKGKTIEQIFDELISWRAFTKLLNDPVFQEESRLLLTPEVWQYTKT